MATGKTLDMRAIDSAARYRPALPNEQKDRDRSLRGKARVRARKNVTKGE